jgi:hypothetical protein
MPKYECKECGAVVGGHNQIVAKQELAKHVKETGHKKFTTEVKTRG